MLVHCFEWLNSILCLNSNCLLVLKGIRKKEGIKPFLFLPFGPAAVLAHLRSRQPPSARPAQRVIPAQQPTCARHCSLSLTRGARTSASSLRHRSSPRPSQGRARLGVRAPPHCAPGPASQVVRAPIYSAPPLELRTLAVISRRPKP
jgi:hypothetical protein